MTLKLKATTGGGSVSLSAPNSTTSNLDVDLTLPVDDGNSGQVLQTNGSGVLSWATVSSDAITEGNTSAEVIDTGSDGRFIVTADGTERLRVDSGGAKITSGALHIDGLGNPTNNYITLRSGTSPSTAGGSGFKAVDHSGANEDGLGCFGHDGISFYTAQSERARIDNSGRLLIGTSTARSGFFNGAGGTDGRLLVETTSNINAFCSVYSAANDGGSYLVLAKQRSGSIGGFTAPNSNDEIGGITFQGADGTDFVEAARIQAFADGTPGANNMPGRLSFFTTADGASSSTERMRIYSTGGTRVFSSNTGRRSNSSVTAGTSTTLFVGTYDATGVGNGTPSFVVWSNGNVQNTNNSYTALSDAKLKENIVNANSQWDDIKALQVRNYNLIEGQTHRQIGLIAQEVEPVSPGLVYESPDRDEDGNDLGTVTKSVNYSVLYMKAVKALQEAMERIESLETANASLEARLTALEGGAS